MRTTRTRGIRPGVWAAIATLLIAGAWIALRPRSQVADDDRPFRERPRANAERDGHGGRRKIARGAAAGGAELQVKKLPPAGAVEGAHARPEDDAAAEDDGASAPDELPYGDGAVGIGAFPPPGTDPLKRGIVVPEDFELPEGFTRHYQTTDDGVELRAILMFHPDYQPVDENGVAIPLPEDRVVPPELAPPGLAIEILDDPEPEIPYIEEAPGAD